jgi:chromosome segregation ATPase
MSEIFLPDPRPSLDVSRPVDAPPRDQSEVFFRIFEALSDIRVSMIRLENKVDRLDDRVTALDQRIDRLEQRVDRLDSRMDRLDRRMDDLEADIHVIRGKVDRVYWTAAVSVALIGLTAPLLWQGLKAWISLG